MTRMTPEYARLLVRDDKQTRNQICDWLRANDIDPHEVPIDASIEIHGGRLAVEVWVRDGDGKHVIHINELVRTTINRPLRVRPTGMVAEWLAAGR